MFGFCTRGSDGTGDVFHEREKVISVKTLSQNNNVVQVLFPKEIVPADITLESTISLRSDKLHFNRLIHTTEENTHIRQSGVDPLTGNEKRTS